MSISVVAKESAIAKYANTAIPKGLRLCIDNFIRRGRIEEFAKPGLRAEPDYFDVVGMREAGKGEKRLD